MGVIHHAVHLIAIVVALPPGSTHAIPLFYTSFTKTRPTTSTESRQRSVRRGRGRGSQVNEPSPRHQQWYEQPWLGRRDEAPVRHKGETHTDDEAHIKQASQWSRISGETDTYSHVCLGDGDDSSDCEPWESQTGNNRDEVRGARKESGSRRDEVEASEVDITALSLGDVAKLEEGSQYTPKIKTHLWAKDPSEVLDASDEDTPIVRLKYHSPTPPNVTPHSGNTTSTHPTTPTNTPQHPTTPTTTSQPWQLMICSLSVLMGAVLSNAAGIGGGGVYVSLLMFLGKFSVRDAVPISKAMIFMSSMPSLYSIITTAARSLYGARCGYGRGNSNKGLSDVDMRVIRRVVPMALSGTSLGVVLNDSVLPDSLTCLILALLLAFVTYKAVSIALATRKDEIKARREQQEGRRLNERGEEGEDELALLGQVSEEGQGSGEPVDSFKGTKDTRDLSLTITTIPRSLTTLISPRLSGRHSPHTPHSPHSPRSPQSPH
eukprot:GHVN01032537.1.p1 GENE.GHVN01032537.1~~GHVN01032537.1.p1  ORF type:complete len:490 (+),score=156.25 GHVN01032537.1:285-1754(+)